MEIKKRISVVLKSEMEKRGLNFMEFSAELDIPRTTLQGYLKGTSSPRADSLEELADKLGISLAELVSGKEQPKNKGAACLEPVFAEIPALHPCAQSTAREAFALLQFAFRQSDFLYKPSDISDAEEIPGMTYRYCLHRLKAPPHRIPAYGILVKERTERGWEVIAVVAPFSRDKEAVELFAERCTRLQLSPKHLLDAIQDFLVP